MLTRWCSYSEVSFVLPERQKMQSTIGDFAPPSVLNFKKKILKKKME